MRTIIAGSRDGITYKDVKQAVKYAGWNITCIISGGARGVDRHGEALADELNIPCEVFLAQWDTYGKSAGYKRNEEMAKNAEALIAVWNGKSKGTKHMIDIAKREGLKVFVYEVIT